MSRPAVAVVGLGRLGAPIAACIAAKGFEVTGADIDVSRVDLVRAGRAPVEEPGLDELIAANHARLRATTRIADAVRGAGVTFVVVPTPSEVHGGFSLATLRPALAVMGDALRDTRDYHLVVITSTVLPGSLRQCVLPILEARSGKLCGPEFGLCYGPELVALGSVIRDFRNPDLVLIGESDDRAGATLAALQAAFRDRAPRVLRMSFESAEVAKLAINTFVTTKIAFANMLADLCERVPCADVDVVTNAVGADSRIGRRYLRGGAAYGGPCFPRDNAALAFLARVLGADALVPEATDAANRAWMDQVADRVRMRVRPGAIVAVLGTAYKADAPVVEASHGLELAQALLKDGYRVRVADPRALAATRAVLGERASYAASARQAVRDADAVVVTTDEAEFRALGPGDFRTADPRVLVVDCWRILARALAGAAHLDYHAVGVGRAATTAPSAGLDALSGGRLCP